MGLIFNPKDLGYFHYPERSEMATIQDDNGYAGTLITGPDNEILAQTVINRGAMPIGTKPLEVICLKAAIQLATAKALCATATEPPDKFQT